MHDLLQVRFAFSSFAEIEADKPEGEKARQSSASS